MASLEVSYSASHKIRLNEADQFEARPGLFFHLAPFGEAEQHPFLTGNVSLLPVFEKGELYLGIEGLKPPQNLALLFQVADGTSDPLVDKPVPQLTWSYLKGNRWCPFDRKDVVDRTRELLDSGIITFAVPREAGKDATLLPKGLHWIKGSVAEGTDAVCRLGKVAAQALEATFTDRSNDSSYTASPLPAGTIAKLDTPDAAVKKIDQPFPSYGGRGKEEAQDFYLRVSERLRHKERGIALWDLERLVLEAFPQIHRVKCLNHTLYDRKGGKGGRYLEIAPGHVTIVTIPEQQYYDRRDPVHPYTSEALLQEIEEFLRPKLSCFTTIHATNPAFEEVAVSCSVRFRAGYDQGYYSGQLQKDLTRFLSPWAFAGGATPSFGGKIYKSVLINFVEDLDYVDYLADVGLVHHFTDSSGERSVSKDVVEGTKAISVLVSGTSHSVTALKPEFALTLPGSRCRP